MKQCKKCGESMTDNQRFCTTCGGSDFIYEGSGTLKNNTVNNNSERKAFCIKCGVENPKDSKFCIACGAAMSIHSEADTESKKDFVPVVNEPEKTREKLNETEQNISELLDEKVKESCKDSILPGNVGKKEPVVGWIVSVKGEDKGEDYRIRSKNNRIGTFAGSDICLSKNKAVSEDDFATIAYYPKKNTFYIIPGDSSDSIKINGDDIEIPTILNSGDMILIGDSEYKFIPLCNESFKWEP